MPSIRSPVAPGPRGGGDLGVSPRRPAPLSIPGMHCHQLVANGFGVAGGCRSPWPSHDLEQNWLWTLPNRRGVRASPATAASRAPDPDNDDLCRWQRPAMVSPTRIIRQLDLARSQRRRAAEQPGAHRPPRYRLRSAHSTLPQFLNTALARTYVDAKLAARRVGRGRRAHQSDVRPWHGNAPASSAGNVVKGLPNASH